jgi:hypothetical protein
LTRFLSCSNPSETSLFRSLREHLLYIQSPVDGCASFFFPSISDLLGAISRFARHELLGGCGERGGEIWAGGFRQEDGGGCTALIGDFSCFGQIADWKHSPFSLLLWGSITSDWGKIYCSEVEESFLGIFRR